MPEHLLRAGAGARAVSPPTASTPGLVVGLCPAAEVARSLGCPCRVALGAPVPVPQVWPAQHPPGMEVGREPAGMAAGPRVVNH